MLMEVQGNELDHRVPAGGRIVAIHLESNLAASIMSLKYIQTL